MDPEKLLLEEWKQNVALYIDQDKRGLERIKMFLTIHAGLLVFYGIIWNSMPNNSCSLIAAWLIVAAGIFFTATTQLMSKRAHAFILLRKMQAMLIEQKLKQMRCPTKLWQTASGIITTFTREHVSFQGEQLEDEKWQPLIDEVIGMGRFAARPVLSLEGWEHSMGHLKWLMFLHIALYALWGALGVLITALYLSKKLGL